MSEPKLTVAELMARAGKEGQSTDAPRRRRRRSLEDGGISVAELTGSIPAVKEKPVESRHSAVKIDDPSGPEEPALIDAAPAPDKPAVTAEPPAKVEPEAKVEPPKPVEKPAASRPAPSNDETIVLSIVDEKDPIRLTTGAFPVVPAAAVKPAAPKVEPADENSAEAAAAAEFAAGESATGASPDQAATSPADTTQLDAVTGDMEAVGVGETVDTVDNTDATESTRTSIFSVILMAVVGVVLGAVVFLAFEMLWERLNNWLVALLAVAVTLGMVGVVHALRTSRDGFSMVLAGIVGLVMTFGPLLIVL